MNKKVRPGPETCRVLRGFFNHKLLPREPFDRLLEQTGAVELIAILWAARQRLSESGALAPEDFQRMEAQRDYIKQRLPDRLYWAAVLTAMEANLGPDAPRADIEDWERGTAILGRKDEWLPKQGRPQGAKTCRPANRDEKEEARRNQVLGAIGAIYRESSELAPVTKKAVAQKLGIADRQLRRWIRDYGWKWEVMECVGTRSILA